MIKTINQDSLIASLDPRKIVHLDLASDDLRQNFIHELSNWAKNPPFYALHDGVVQVICARYADAVEVYKDRERFSVEVPSKRTYTHVIPVGNRTVQMGFALIEDTVNDAGETVMVRLSNARVVDAYGNVVNFLDITRAEATGTINAPSPTTTNVSGLTIRIQDATGDEDDGWLDFKVRLSRKYDDYVCYDFESISGGTATEGRDYSKRPKVRQWVQIGKRVDKPFVRIIDDLVNDNGETVKVKISNAHLCDDASQTVSITRAEATGTIRNTDPMMIADYPVGKIAEYPADKDDEAFSATPRDAANASFEQPSAAADVAVTDTGGETTPVTPPAAVPAPAGLEATEGANGIVLNWSAPAATTDTVDGYIVNRCEGAGCIPGYYYWVPSGTTYTDRAVMANTLYRYSVSAHFSSSDKTSDWSNVIERTMGIVEAGLNYRDQVQIMYAAYYGRPGDAGGLGFWATELEKVNGNLSRIIYSFGKSEEFQDRFGDLDDEELVNNSYLQLLGRDADSGGLKFYVNGLREGRFTLASIALNVANGTQNLDEMIKANKLRAANAFTEACVEAGAAYGEFQIDDAKLWLAGVDSTLGFHYRRPGQLARICWRCFPKQCLPCRRSRYSKEALSKNINILKSSNRISPGTRVAGNSRPRV